MKYILPLIFLLPLALHGQQGVQYSQYMLNKFRVNPAYAGLDNSLSATGVYRDQWVGLEGRPKTQNFNIHMPIYLLRGGIGINIENDMTGAEQNLGASLSYAYYLKLDDNALISIGASGGIRQKTLDGTLLRTPEGIYGPDPGPIIHNDGSLPNTNESAFAPNFGFGVFFKSEKIEAGISMENLAETPIKFSFQDNTDIIQKRTFFTYLAYNFEIGKRFSLSPSFLLKSDFIQTQMEFSGILTYNDNIFLGSTFRGYESNSIDAVVFLAGFKLNEKITLSYSYDLTLSDLQLVSNGSHEIMFNYNLNKDFGRGIPEKLFIIQDSYNDYNNNIG